MKDPMPRNLNILIILVLLSALYSCEKNDDDQFIKDQIIGNWKSTNSYYKSYTFKENSTFIDTTFYLFSENPSIYRVKEIIAGDFKINNGQLSFSNIRLVYFNGQGNVNLLGYSTTYDPLYDISFDNDILVLNQKDIFNPLDKSTSSIIGKWKHDKLVAVYDKNLSNKFTGGYVYGIYDFKSDLTVNWQYETKYENIINTSSTSTTYDFADSRLNINQWGLYNLTISINKDKMIWLYSDRTFQKKQ